LATQKSCGRPTTSKTSRSSSGRTGSRYAMSEVLHGLVRFTSTPKFDLVETLKSPSIMALMWLLPRDETAAQTQYLENARDASEPLPPNPLGRRLRERYVSVGTEQCGSTFRCRQPLASTAFCRCWGRHLPLPKPFKSAILASNLPGIWRMSVNSTSRLCGRPLRSAEHKVWERAARFAVSSPSLMTRDLVLRVLMPVAPVWDIPPCRISVSHRFVHAHSRRSFEG
jgi:hypothetical protein